MKEALYIILIGAVMAATAVLLIEDLKNSIAEETTKINTFSIELDSIPPQTDEITNKIIYQTLYNNIDVVSIYPYKGYDILHIEYKPIDQLFLVECEGCSHYVGVFKRYDFETFLASSDEESAKKTR